VEHHAVEDVGQQDHPEQHADAEEEPRYLGEAERHSGHRHQYIAHRVDEPGRIEVWDFSLCTVHPDIDHVQREEQMQHTTGDPQ
jgi:hypothetical protein